MKPFLKWAGGKYKIIEKIKTALPAGKRLIEPFAGSGAVFLNTAYENYLIADANADLINLFHCVQKDKQNFIEQAQQLFIPENNQETRFYEFREEFNHITDLKRKAALFIYLNRHCFNGLCRYNSKGKFNVPFGRYKHPSFPEQALITFSEKSQHAIFKQADFVETLHAAKLGDVVYCDPPYAPLNATSNFTSYTQAVFNLEHQQQLAEIALELANKGIPVIISNHDTEFTRQIYAQAKLEFFDVQRFISSNAANRNKAGELLAIF